MKLNNPRERCCTPDATTRQNRSDELQSVRLQSSLDTLGTLLEPPLLTSAQREPGAYCGCSEMSSAPLPSTFELAPNALPFPVPLMLNMPATTGATLPVFWWLPSAHGLPTLK